MGRMETSWRKKSLNDKSFCAPPGRSFVTRRGGLTGVVERGYTPSMDTNTALTEFSPQNATEAEEYAVYDALIKALYLKYKFELIVIRHQTGLHRS
jgi:hypothetical protein